MLSVEQLYVNYGEKEILHDVDLQVAQEEIVMIVGESGSGKVLWCAVSWAFWVKKDILLKEILFFRGLICVN